MKKESIISILCCLLSFTFLAQNALIESLSIEDGLSQGMIFDIVQDMDGFIWIATKDGLNRYDGKTFKHYNHDPFAPFSISGNTVTKLLEDQHGRLWVGTETTGLNLFDKKSELFFNISTEGAKDKSISDVKIKSLIVDQDGKIWIGTNGGLNILKWTKELPPVLTKEFNIQDYFEIKQLVAGRPGIPFESIIFSNLFASSKNEVWSSSFREILKFDLEGQLLEKEHLTDDLANHTGTGEFAEDADGNIWLVKYFAVFNNKGGIWKTIKVPSKFKGDMSDILIEKERGILINSKKGILNYNEKSDSFAVYLDYEEKDYVKQTVIRKDQSGNIWLGTGGYGIRKYNPRKRHFQHFLEGISISNFFQDREGKIWFCLRFGNTYRTLILNESTNKLEEAPELPLYFVDFIQLKDGTFWGLQNYNEERKISNFTEFDKVARQKKYYPVLNQIDPGKMMEDGGGNIWKSDNEGKLIQFFPKTRSHRVFDISHLVPSTRKSVALLDGKNRHIWFGTENGLIRGIPQKDTFHFVHLKNEKDNPNSLNNNFILSLLDDPIQPDQYLWIGTKGGGLNLLNKKTGEIEHFTTKDGLPNNVVYGILEDDFGNLWMSTNRGLSKFNLEERSFENYSVGDGLQDNEFNTLSFAKGTDGRLFFGGINGLTAFYPEDLEASNFQSPVYITQLKINNEFIDHKAKSGILNRPIEQTSTIILKHNQNLLTFEFASLDYTNPERNQYQYFLEGVDPDWIITGNDNSANYANLAPGEYTFYVKGSNSSGVWNEKTTQLKITILPPWWKTNLAYGFYLLAILAIFYSIYRFQINRVKLQNQLIFEQKEAERLSELDRIKTNFFSNITHEFRTPLTLIIEPLRQILRNNDNLKFAPKLKLVQNNSEKLLQLVNQLLDLSKLEGQQMKLDLRKGDILETVRPLYQSFLALAQKKGIQLKFDANKNLEEFYFDKNKVEKVVYNLLSNAVKFTESGLCQLSIVQPAPKVLQIIVRDTGVGIPNSDLPKIFDRFYQVDASTTRENEGTGIGLSLTKELVELMGGSIVVESEVGKGTQFLVEIPFRVMSEASSEIQSEEVLQKPIPKYQKEEPTHHSSLITNNSSIKNNSSLILLIEDNPEMRLFIKHSLPESYQIVEASNGDEGIKKAMDLIPDLVISDLMMPKKDGFEVTDILKNDEKTSHIPIILLTAKSAIESKIKGLKRGADAYLTKPFHTEELEVRIEKLIESRRLMQEKFSQSKSTNQLTKQSLDFLSDIDNEFLRKFTLQVEEHIDDENLSIEALSQKMSLSRSQLHRKIKGLTGQNATDFIRNYRLDRAMELLKNKEGNVSQIAIMVGFGSQKYFSTRFKERFGKSPSEV